MLLHRLHHVALMALIFALSACPDPLAPAPSSADASSDAGSDTSLPDAGPSVVDNFGVTESQGEQGCDNLDTSHCLFPFPSDFFFDTDGERPSLRFGVSLPRPTGEPPLSDEHFRTFDGFSVVTPVRFHLPDVDLSTAPGLGDIDASTRPGSPTVVIDAETGALQPHWAEIDHFSMGGSQPRITTIRFPKPLAPGRRFIVAVRELTDGAGATIAASAAFAAVRDRAVSTWRGMHARRDHYEAAIFPALEAVGVAREALQLAWDFTTQSGADATGLAQRMRDALYAAIGDDGPVYSLAGVEELVDHPHIARVVTVEAEVPSFMLPMVDATRRVRLDPTSGDPVIEGTERVAFTLQIPHSVVAAPGSAPVIQYGHGLLGSAGEANSGWFRAMADRHGFVIAAADMQGMNEDNIITWASILGAPERFPHLSEEPLQGIMNHLAIVRLLKGAFTAESSALASDNGAPLYDPDQIHYYGNSQGGTLGTIIMALSRDLQRGVLGVPGCAFEFLLHRSTGFTGYADILSLTYPPTEFIALVTIISLGFSRLEGVAFAPDIEAGEKRVLLHVAKEDSVVDNKASYLLGRATGSTLLTPAVRPVWGVSESASPIAQGNVLVEVDFGHPDNPDPWKPGPEEHDTHEDLRRNATAQDQLYQFLTTGVVAHLCEGVCDPD